MQRACGRESVLRQIGREDVQAVLSRLKRQLQRARAGVLRTTELELHLARRKAADLNDCGALGKASNCPCLVAGIEPFDAFKVDAIRVSNHQTGLNRSCTLRTRTIKECESKARFEVGIRHRVLLSSG